ncbi:MAG: monofunctional biosynthetic peptidoglycan transglycosylase [Bacteroidales bacterium]|nr:monofunctional biosynthetic peptidoglycan transglycosylase [Bacteroidales bacterium]
MAKKSSSKKISFKQRLFRIFKWTLKVTMIFFVSTVLLVFAMRWINPVTSSIIVQRQISGLFKGEFELIKYHWVSYDDVSKFMPIAIVAAEDQNFPKHFGFDFKQIEKALKENQRGRRVRGASTITQQVAKNLFLWEGKSFLRKGIEAYFTLLIELLWDKQRILEVHMNIAEMGDKIFGVGTASVAYFKKPAANLNIRQAALLAAILPNPKKYSAIKPSGYVRGRQSWIVRQINSLGGPDYLKDL